MKASNCCGADIIENTDICSNCKEHCFVVDDEFEEIMSLDNKKITYNGKEVKNEPKQINNQN